MELLVRGWSAIFDKLEVSKSRSRLQSLLSLLDHHRCTFRPEVEVDLVPCFGSSLDRGRCQWNLERRHILSLRQVRFVSLVVWVSWSLWRVPWARWPDNTVRFRILILLDLDLLLFAERRHLHESIVGSNAIHLKDASSLEQIGIWSVDSRIARRRHWRVFAGCYLVFLCHFWTSYSEILDEVSSRLLTFGSRVNEELLRKDGFRLQSWIGTHWTWVSDLVGIVILRITLFCPSMDELLWMLLLVSW